MWRLNRFRVIKFKNLGDVVDVVGRLLLDRLVLLRLELGRVVVVGRLRVGRMVFRMDKVVTTATATSVVVMVMGMEE